MGLKFTRKKEKNYLVSFLYRLFNLPLLNKNARFKLILNLEWIFDRLAHEYSFKLYDIESHPIRVNTINFLSKKIKNNYTVFDLGCHKGDLSFLVSKISGSVLGIDNNELWIENAKNVYGSNDKLQFVCDEAYSYLNNNNLNYNVLLLSHILEHLDDPKDFLQKFKNNFDFIYIEVPDFEKTFLNDYRKTQKLKLSYLDDDHISEFDRMELNLLLAECGIEIDDAEYRNGVQRIWSRVVKN